MHGWNPPSGGEGGSHVGSHTHLFQAWEEGYALPTEVNILSKNGPWINFHPFSTCANLTQTKAGSRVGGTPSLTKNLQKGGVVRNPQVAQPLPSAKCSDPNTRNAFKTPQHCMIVRSKRRQTFEPSCSFCHNALWFRKFKMATEVQCKILL